jgi:type IV secretory pathway TraG/TraD family ATPase VirD4
LLTYKPTADELAWWLSHDEEIDRRVKGTEVASLIAPSAPAQREGILSELKMVGKVLKLLPKQQETTAHWNTREWAKRRRGWLFLTSTPDTRERLAPLISLWLDTLVLRLMFEGMTNPHARQVWFVLDELASLQKLPQLHTAVTENRKANCPMILGFQGRSQLEARYGLEAEAMLAQPATKIFLRTNEAKSAKWISETIGDVEIELLRETRSQSHHPEGRDTKSFQLERRVQPLIMPSEISGLPSLHGYLKSGNYVVQLSFPYVGLPKLQQGFVPREFKPMQPPNGNTPEGQQPQNDEPYWR